MSKYSFVFSNTANADSRDPLLVGKDKNISIPSFPVKVLNAQKMSCRLLTSAGGADFAQLRLYINDWNAADQQRTAMISTESDGVRKKISHPRTRFEDAWNSVRRATRGETR